MTKQSSSNSTRYDSLFSTTSESVSSVIATIHRLGTMNSISITTSFPYVNLNGVCPVNFLLVVLYAHNTAGIFNS
jgi:hypothetical protein